MRSLEKKLTGSSKSSLQMPSSFSLAGSHFPSPASKTLTGAADGGLTRTRIEEIERRSPNIGEEVCVGEDGRLMKVFVKKGRGVN